MLSEERHKVDNELKKALLQAIIDANGETVYAAELAKRFNIEDNVTSTTTRAAIKDGLRLFGVEMQAPIGANSKGYFLIKTRIQFDEYMENLYGRIAGIQERMTIVRDIWESVVYNELSFKRDTD